MPVFEYKCGDCGNKFEVLHKSSVQAGEVDCPSCHSLNNKKLFSSFSASVNSSSTYSTSPCASGNCGVDYSGGCSSGMCGLN
ncbi:MAG: zinc ribbon domain-containing protein [Ignavibacteriales bacterium]|nr:zinc ribbon domain-containing protein [Ignavibacteriaceae bacterium]NLH60125.1 zinc ribbon domain-containing protein [Ignavibacteriales bacterium]HOJ18592.1 zinc ribbon domain-containing protein [Ignavibacteriaceae bacterium]HPO55453.1 zinc ribbon domain-containing protein [Ignavibacteriaceae bacterium]